MEARILKINGIYKHFKGNVYIAEDIVYDAEKNVMMVLYKDINSGKRWVRHLSDFLSEVDHEKYPNVTQKYRFELQE